MDFRDTSFYDVPGMLAQQTLSGNLDVRNTLLNREALSPSQRRSLYEAGTGGGFKNRVVDTLGEIFTNPFTYLALLTGPVGAKALKEGKSLMSVASSKHPLLKKSLGFLESIGAMAPVKMAGPEAEAHVVDAAHKVSETMANAAAIKARSQSRLLTFLSEKMGRKITTLNPDDFSDPEERKFMQRLQAALGAKAHGLDNEQPLRYQEFKADRAYAVDRHGRPVVDADGVEQVVFKPGELGTEDNMESFRTRMKDRDAELKRTYGEAQKDVSEKYRKYQKLKDSRKSKDPAMRASKAEINEARNVFVEAKERLDSMPHSLKMSGKMETVELPEEARKPLVSKEAVDSFLSSVDGADEYLKGHKQITDYMLVRKIGNESSMLVKDADGVYTVKEGWTPESFEYDDDKVRRLLDYQRNNAIKMGGGRSNDPRAVGENLVNLMADDVSPVSWDIHKSRTSRGRMLPDLVDDVGQEDVDRWKGMFTGELKTARDSGGWASRNSFDVEDILQSEKGFMPDEYLDLDPVEAVRLTRAEIAKQRSARPPNEVDPSGRGIEDFDERGTVSTSSMMPRTDLKPSYSSRDLETLMDAGFLTDDGVEHILDNRQQAMSNARRVGENSRSNTNRDVRTRTISLNLERSTTRSVREGAALHSYVTGGSDVEWDLDFVKGAADSDVKTRKAPGTPGRRRQMQKGDSNWRGLTLLSNAATSDVRKNVIRDIIVPVMTGIDKEDRVAALTSMYRQKSWAGWLADSWIGKAMEKYGGKAGGEYVRGLRQFASDDTMPTMGGSMSQKAASYLYVTHMGFNMASVALNLLQPLTNAATVTDPVSVMSAYGKAFKSIFGYATDRAKLGLRMISHTERNALIKKHFAWADDIGLTADFMKIIDADHLGREGTIMSKAARIAMSGFEKSEWMNRAVTAHILESAYKKAGRVPGVDASWASDLRGFIARTQFGADNQLFRPAAFNRQTAEGFKPFRVTNPVFRMFMQFPMNTATTFFVDAPGWGGEENYVKGLARHSLRALGYGAIVFETARGLFGADLSRGLPASAATDIIGGNKMLYEDQWYPVPPILRMPVSMIRGVMGDQTEFVQAMSALIPGGMALSRAMSMAPETPLTGILQKTYADYSSVQSDGTVPVYKADGTLIGYQKPSEIVLKGLGVDLGSGQLQGKIDGYLIKQRQQIINYRQEFLRKLAGNDISGAEAVRRDFSAKYKDPETGAPLPLTVTQAQVKQYLRSRDNIGRTERILDSLSPDVRMQMANSIGSSVGAGADLSSGMTAAQRERYNPTARDERVQEIWNNVQSVGAAATADTGPVGPAATFTQGQ